MIISRRKSRRAERVKRNERAKKMEGGSETVVTMGAQGKG